MSGEVEARAYGPDSTPEEIEAIKARVYMHSEGVVMYRHALLLTDGAEAGLGQLEGMLGTAVEACERYYQTFQYVLWGGKSPEEAIAAVLFETVGEA